MRKIDGLDWYVSYHNPVRVKIYNSDKELDGVDTLENTAEVFALWIYCDIYYLPNLQANTIGHLD